MRGVLVALVALSFFGPFAARAADKGHAQNPPGHSRGAPGPVVGVGLPALILVGGAYWLLRRRNRRV